jgi:hypothetical protein
MEKSEDMNKVLSMPLREFYLLISMSGADSVFGYEYTCEALSETDILEALNNLVRQNILTSDGEKFECSREYKKIVDYVHYAAEGLVIQGLNDELPECIVYLGDEFLVTNTQLSNADRILIQWKDADGLYQFVKDMGYLEQIWEHDILSEKEQVLFSVRRIDFAEMRITRELRITAHEGQCYIVSEENVSAVRYESGLLKQLFYSLVS